MEPRLRTFRYAQRALTLHILTRNPSTIASNAQLAFTVMDLWTTQAWPLASNSVLPVTTVHQGPPSVISSHANPATTMMKRRMVGKRNTTVNTADSINTAQDMEIQQPSIVPTERTTLTQQLRQDAVHAKLATSAIGLPHQHHTRTRSPASRANTRARAQQNAHTARLELTVQTRLQRMQT